MDIKNVGIRSDHKLKLMKLKQDEKNEMCGPAES